MQSFAAAVMLAFAEVRLKPDRRADCCTDIGITCQPGALIHHILHTIHLI